MQRPWGSGTSARVLGGAQVGRFVAGATGAKGQNVQDVGVWVGDEAGLKTRAPEPAFLSLSCGGRGLSFIRDCSLQGAGSPEPSRVQRYLGGRCRSRSGILEVAVCVGPDSGILGRGGGEGIIRTSTPQHRICVSADMNYSLLLSLTYHSQSRELAPDDYQGPTGPLLPARQFPIEARLPPVKGEAPAGLVVSAGKLMGEMK